MEISDELADKLAEKMRPTQLDMAKTKKMKPDGSLEDQNTEESEAIFDAIYAEIEEKKAQTTKKPLWKRITGK